MNANPASKHVFLSYSRDDAYVMIQIRKELERLGISVWTDEGLIPGTESWKRDIEKAIRDALGIVVILSPSANQSLWVEREMDFARVHGIRIFPVLVHGEPNNAIPIELINAQWVDLRKKEDFNLQMRSLVLAIEGKRSERSVILERPQKRKAPKPKGIQSSKTIIAISAVIAVICIILAITLSFVGPKLIALLATPTPTKTEYSDNRVTVTHTMPPSDVQPVPSKTPIPPNEQPTQTNFPDITKTESPPGETLFPTKTSTIPPTEPETVQAGFQDNCLHSTLWTTYPTASTSDSNGCLITTNFGFGLQHQSLMINVQNPSSDQRYGIYVPIHGNVSIELNARIDQLSTGADNELSSLGFGIVPLNPTQTDAGEFIFYVIESNLSGYPVFLKKGERGGTDAFAQYIQIDGDYYKYNLGTNQRLYFQVDGNQLSIYINGGFIRSAQLNFNERAFFIGYKFENIGSLSAELSDLTIVEN